MKNGEWKIIPHSYQIADTGDYDGHYELTNGTISLITRDDVDTDNPDIDGINHMIEIMNELDIKWENGEAADLRFELHMEKQYHKDLRKALQRIIDSYQQRDDYQLERINNALKDAKYLLNNIP